MDQPRDNFSRRPDLYRRFRPTYPEGLYQRILSHTTGRDRAWDCATGNGQAAAALQPHFTRVDATDISKRQLEEAIRLPGLHYAQARAEQTPFEDQAFDLVTVAQAMHWLQPDPFYAELRRVARPGATLAIWGYGLLSFAEGKLNELIGDFYHSVVGPYWDPERQLIDDHYRSLSFPFRQLADFEGLQIQWPFTPASLAGYLSSWSAVGHYRQREGADPVRDWLQPRLEHLWEQGERTARFPLFGYIGRVD